MGRQAETTDTEMTDDKLLKVMEDLGLQIRETRNHWDDMTRKFEAKRVSLYGGDNVQAAIPRRFRPQIRLAEIADVEFRSGRTATVGDREVRRGFFAGDPVLKTGAGAWLHMHLTKLLRPGEYDREQHAILTEALGLGQGVEKVALQEDVASEGGNLVPTVIEGEMLRLITDNGLLRPLVRKVTMTTKTHAYPTRAAAITAAIIAEEASITDSIPATPISQSNLTAKKLAGFATVSSELMQDNVVMFADYLGTEFAEQIARAEDQQALEGDGTGVNFTGVIAAAGVNSLVSGANGEVLYWQKLAEVPWTANEASSRGGGYWFFGPKLMKVLVKSRADAVTAADNAGLPIFTSPSAGIGAPVPPGLLGFPYVIHSGLRTDITRGTGTALVNAYFGPPRSIIFGDLLGFRIDLNPYSKFQSFQVDVRGVKRTAILVGVPSAWTKYIAIDPGAPMKP